jgi:hypothetical protein
MKSNRLQTKQFFQFNQTIDSTKIEIEKIQMIVETMLIPFESLLLKTKHKK